MPGARQYVRYQSAHEGRVIGDYNASGGHMYIRVILPCGFRLTDSHEGANAHVDRN